MTPIESMLIDLVQIAESPLYSAYRWLGRELGRDVRLDAFLRLIDQLLRDEKLRLWRVDPESQERTRVFRIPAGIERRYTAEPSLDPAFDPFGLSLTLGPEAPRDEDSEWEVDFDFDEGRFTLVAVASREEEAVAQLKRLFPDVGLLTVERTRAGGRVQIAGTISDVSPAP
jgi:hypothetical protein